MTLWERLGRAEEVRDLLTDDDKALLERGRECMTEPRGAQTLGAIGPLVWHAHDRISTLQDQVLRLQSLVINMQERELRHLARNEELDSRLALVEAALSLQEK